MPDGAAVDGGDVGALGDPPVLDGLAVEVRADLAQVTGQRRVAAPRCAAEARAAAPDGTALRWVADGRAGNTAVVVLALVGAGADLVLVAADPADCEVLATARS